MKNKKTKWLYLAGVIVLVVAFFAMANYGVLGENLQGRIKVPRLRTNVEVAKVQNVDISNLNNVAVEKDVVSADLQIETIDPEVFQLPPTEQECQQMYNVLLWWGGSHLSEWMENNNMSVHDIEYCSTHYGTDWANAGSCYDLKTGLENNGNAVFGDWLSNNNYTWNDVSTCQAEYDCGWPGNVTTCEAMLKQLKLGGAQGLSQWMTTNNISSTEAYECSNTWYKAEECNDILDLVEANPGEWLTTWLPTQGYSFSDYTYCYNL